jgi:hypothetical protein
MSAAGLRLNSALISRQHLGPDVAVHAALGAAHGGAHAIDDDDIAGIETHV